MKGWRASQAVAASLGEQACQVVEEVLREVEEDLAALAGQGVLGFLEVLECLVGVGFLLEVVVPRDGLNLAGLAEVVVLLGDLQVVVGAHQADQVEEEGRPEGLLVVGVERLSWVGLG